MNLRAALLLVALGAGLVGAAAACGQAFVAGSPGGSAGTSASSTATSSGSGGRGASSGPLTSTASSSSSSASSSGVAACDFTHPELCGPDQYCNVPACAGPGTCAPITTALTDFAPKCGCNGATYWNGAVAVIAKEPIRLDGHCDATNAAACSLATNPCINLGARCNLAAPLGGSCNTPPTTGMCWVLPASCTGTLGAGVACMTSTCRTACDLIEAEMPWVTSSCTP
jgi:hypothetical protein